MFNATFNFVTCKRNNEQNAIIAVFYEIKPILKKPVIMFGFLIVGKCSLSTAQFSGWRKYISIYFPLNSPNALLSWCTNNNVKMYFTPKIEQKNTI